MDTNQAAQALGSSQSADRTALDSDTRPLEPESSLDASWSHLPRETFDQMPLNYSRSQAAASSTQDSHYRYRKRDMPREAMDSVTESGLTTDDVSFYSYHSARDLSAFVKEVDGRFVCSVMRSLYSPRYLECLIINQNFTRCRAVNISTKTVSRSHTKIPH
jgi:hypothetical protein